MERHPRIPLYPGGHTTLLVPQSSYKLQQCCQMAKFDPFPSLDCVRVEGVGRNQILQRSVVEPLSFKPKGANTYKL